MSGFRRERIAKGDALVSMLSQLIPKFYFKLILLSLILSGTSGNSRFLPRKQMHVFYNVVHVFPKPNPFVVATSTSNRVSKPLFPDLCSDFLKVFEILRMELFEGSEEGSTFLALLSMELLLFGSEFHTTPFLRRKRRSVPKKFSVAMY
jgi:hypothetical protein